MPFNLPIFDIIFYGLSVLLLLYIIRIFYKMPVKSFYRSYKAINKVNIPEFLNKLNEYYDNGEYSKGICHYYSIMGDVISASKGDFWHFAPFNGSSSDMEAIEKLHHLFLEKLNTSTDQKILEIGCGYGRNVRWLAQHTGAFIHGITLSPVEVEFVKNKKKTDTIKNYDVCEGDYHNMYMFEDNTFDRVIAVYCLKYSNNLEAVFSEIQRILKPGGLFLSYEILTTEKYDNTDPLHKEYVNNICSSTSMPPLHNVRDFIKNAKRLRLKIKMNQELSNGNDTWYKYFLQTGTYDLVSSGFINHLVGFAESIGLIQSGFKDFYNRCIVHPPVDFVEAGKLGIVTGSRLMIFEK